jgi:hypothetical protein
MSEFITAEKAKTINLSEYRGRTGKISLDGLHVGVKIADARVRFGHLDLLVTPVNGDGEKWIESRRVNIDTPI